MSYERDFRDQPRLFKLVRASGGGRRSGQRSFTPLIGRDEEIAMLMRRWERARGGDGQLVLIVGEPGLGKSRLMEEFHVRLRETPHTWVEWSCSQLLFETLRRVLGDGFVGTTLPDSAGNPNGRMPPHSVFATELIDAQGQPTRAAVDDVIAFFRERLPARAAG
jgi:predicted ATPase